MKEHSHDEAILQEQEKRGEYEPPRVCESARFESLALSCGFGEGEPGACAITPFSAS